MSIKYVFAVSVCCCAFLALINAQSQNYVDTKFEEAKERDKYKNPVAMPFLGPQNQPQDRPRNTLNAKNEGFSNPTQTTLRPLNQQQDSQRNQKKNEGSRTTPRPQNQRGDSQRNPVNSVSERPQNQNNRSQNGPQLEPIYFYPRLTNTVHKYESYSKCIRSQGMSGCQHQESESGYQMNVLASDIPDNRRPRQF